MSATNHNAAAAVVPRPAAVPASRAVGVAGLVAVVLIFVPAVMQSGQEPGFTADAGAVTALVPAPRLSGRADAGG